MVYDRDDVEGLDAAILTKQSVLQYSDMRKLYRPFSRL